MARTRKPQSAEQSIQARLALREASHLDLRSGSSPLWAKTSPCESAGEGSAEGSADVAKAERLQSVAGAGLVSNASDVAALLGGGVAA